MSAGVCASRENCIPAPTVMKKTPSNSPLKGSSTLTSSWRYSLSASTTPARKVPSAAERPTQPINSAVDITSKSEAAKNISCRPVRPMARNTGRVR